MKDKSIDINNKKVSLISLGCSKNLVDSEFLTGGLKNENFIMTDHPEESDIAIVNTCGFLDKSREEGIDTILELGELKDSNIIEKIVVMGCFSERFPTELKKELPEVDEFFGTKKIITEIVNNNSKPDIQSTTQNNKSTFQFKDGEYIGNLKNGLPNGNGVVAFPNGDKYEGEFREGFYEGEGILTIKDYGKYEGQWVEGKKHGMGRFNYEDGTWSAGEWMNGKPWNVINYNFNGVTNMKWIQGTLNTSK